MTRFDGLILLAGVLLLASAVHFFPLAQSQMETARLAAIYVPEFDRRERDGAETFAIACAICHGVHGTGGTAPRLIGRFFPDLGGPVAALSDRLRGCIAQQAAAGSDIAGATLPPSEGGIEAISAYLRRMQRANPRG